MSEREVRHRPVASTASKTRRLGNPIALRLTGSITDQRLVTRRLSRPTTRQSCPSVAWAVSSSTRPSIRPPHDRFKLTSTPARHVPLRRHRDADRHVVPRRRRLRRSSADVERLPQRPARQRHRDRCGRSAQQTLPNPVYIGQRPAGGFLHADLSTTSRIYNERCRRPRSQPTWRLLDRQRVERPHTADRVDLFSAANAQVSDIVTVTANASDNVGVVGVQSYVDKCPSAAPRTRPPRTVCNGTRDGIERGPHVDRQCNDRLATHHLGGRRST